MSDELYPVFSYKSRTICDILSEMRDCAKTANYSYLPGLIEEVQSSANKMEACLDIKKNIITYQEERSTLKKEERNLINSIKKLRKEVEELESEKARRNSKA
jgi:hypothetical protein